MYDDFFRWYDAGDTGKRARVFAKITVYCARQGRVSCTGLLGWSCDRARI